MCNKGSYGCSDCQRVDHHESGIGSTLWDNHEDLSPSRRSPVKHSETEQAGLTFAVAGMVLPKAIDRVASEVGGLSALQREGECGEL